MILSSRMSKTIQVVSGMQWVNQ